MVLRGNVSSASGLVGFVSKLHHPNVMQIIIGHHESIQYFTLQWRCCLESFRLLQQRSYITRKSPYVQQEILSRWALKGKNIHG